MDTFSSHLVNCKFCVSNVLCLILLLCLWCVSLPVMSNELNESTAEMTSTSINLTTSHIIESEPIIDSETISGWRHIPGWRCHCWNSTNESEVHIFF